MNFFAGVAVASLKRDGGTATFSRPIILVAASEKEALDEVYRYTYSHFDPAKGYFNHAWEAVEATEEQVAYFLSFHKESS